MITPTDLLNLPDQKSYDILNLIKPMMISMYQYVQNIKIKFAQITTLYMPSKNINYSKVFDLLDVFHYTGVD